PFPATELKGKTIQMAGYPKDKCEYLDINKYVRGARCQYDLPPAPNASAGAPALRQFLEVQQCLGGGPWDKRATAQFGAKGKIIQPEAIGAMQFLIHDIDSCEGQSGGPVWLESGKSTYLIGVHTGPFGTQGNCPDPTRGGFSETNRAVLTSTDVRRQ